MGNLAAEQTVRTREYLTQREIDKLMDAARSGSRYFEYTAKGKFKLPIAVVARQIGPIWNDYCGNGEAESERCNFLRNLMKP
jgi:hypothetical protein